MTVKIMHQPKNDDGRQQKSYTVTGTGTRSRRTQHDENRASRVELRVKRFSLHLAEVESAVPLHKTNDGFKLLVYETSIA